MNENNFGEFLRKKRLEKKLTLVELSNLSGVSQPHLSHIENGKRGTPSPEMLKRISEGLGVDYSELLYKAEYIDEKTLDQINTTFGETLKEQRKKKDFTLDELSDKTKLSKDYLLSLENDKEETLSLNDIKEISTALKIDSSILFRSILNHPQNVNDIYNDEDNANSPNAKRYLVHKLDKVLDGSHHVVYKKKQLTKEQLSDIVKFIDNFVIDHQNEGDK